MFKWYKAFSEGRESINPQKATLDIVTQKATWGQM